MLLLTLDPSSTRIGYALGDSAEHVIEAGVIRPPDAADESHVRARAMALECDAMAKQWKPDRMLVERPSPQSPRLGAAGQAKYGEAVGIVLATLWDRVEIPVQCVRADIWKRRVPKKHLMACVAQWVPGYDVRQDRGGDCADAVGLLWWWFAEQKARE